MLNPFFNPKGVAVIGASRNPRKLGYGVVRNLADYHYKGPVYPVNPVASEILDYRCYPDIESVPDPVDLAIIVVASSEVGKILAQCGEREIHHVIIVSGGFGETGEKGKKLESELKEIARQFDIRIIGPNCIGTIDTHTPVNTTFVVGMPIEGEIGFISQSGAMVAAVIDWARGAGVGFSRIVSLGNQIDVTETEMMSSIASDRQTKVLTAYIEGVSEGRNFIQISKELAQIKPVIVLKGGHGISGAQAVASHTGALAGSDEAYDAAFRQSGVLRASTMEELFDWARALAWQPLPSGNRIAILTNAGGPAILAVDTFESYGLKMATLSEETQRYLKKRLPPAASVHNPVDVLAGSGPGSYAVALDALLSDPNVDAVHVIQAPQDWFLPESLAEVVGEVAEVHHKPVLASFMGLASVEKALSILHKRHIPNFAFPERAASAMAAMLRRAKWLEKSTDVVSGFTLETDQIKAKKALENNELSTFVQLYDIPVPESVVLHSKNELKKIDGSIEFPVVLKLISRDITHKSDVGGVVTDINSREMLENALDKIHSNARTNSPNAKVDGYLLQPMYKGGLEFIIGFRRDAQFGPLLLVGSGGTDVEYLRDIQIGIIPVNEYQANELLKRTHLSKKLNGWRGSDAYDKQAIIDVMLRVSKMAMDFPELEEFEINPLKVFVKGSGCIALDIRSSGITTHTPES